MLNLCIPPKDTAEVKVVHPGTHEPLCSLTIAGPDHEKTLARRREMDDLRQDPTYKPDFQREIQATLCIRTVGWTGVKDENGKEVPFDSSLLPDLYAQDWLRVQVLVGLEGNSVFFKG